MVRNLAIPFFVVLFVVIVVVAGRKTPSTDSTNQPASCRLAFARLSGDKPIDREIAQQQSLIVRENFSPVAIEKLGWLYVKKARLSFDTGFYKLAEQCAACLEARDSKGAETLLLRAHALQSLHHFREAETAARELVILRQRPFDYGVLGDILIDQGKVREGAAAYQKMVDSRPDLQSYARAAHVRWLTGDLNGAIELMQLATSAASPGDPEAGAWAFTRLALYQLQRGATKPALDSCDAALSLHNEYAPAMLARGRTLLAMNRAHDAVVEVQRAAELNPLPEYQWILAEALNLTGNRHEAAKIESQLAGKTTEDARTISLYFATRRHDVERAIALAQQELTNRADVFTLDALAWALAAAGRTTEAGAYIRRALSEGTVDSRLYLHAGIIAALNHDNSQARRFLDQAAAAQHTLLPSERVQLDDYRQNIVRKTDNKRTSIKE